MNPSKFNHETTAGVALPAARIVGRPFCFRKSSPKANSRFFPLTFILFGCHAAVGDKTLPVGVTVFRVCQNDTRVCFLIGVR